MRLDSADIRLFLGKSGSGKSTLARSQLAKAPRVLIFDPNGEPDHAKGAIVTDSQAELVELVGRKGKVRICWRGVMLGGVDAFEWANRCAWAGEGFHVFWDEVDRFSTPHRLPPIASNLVNAGRHRGLHIFAASRRPHAMNRTLSALATRMAIFRTTEPRDIRYFSEYIGDQAKLLPTLRDYHCLDWTEAGAVEKKSPFR